MEALHRELSALEAQVSAGASTLGTVFAHAGDSFETARSELERAQESLQQALCLEVDSEWRVEAEDPETLAEAMQLRSEAQRARDVAEANLLRQRAERIELLQRLQEVTRQNSRAIERHQAQLDKEADLEKLLVAECEERERETQEIRDEILAQGRRLDARNTVTTFFQVPPRDAARRHAKALQEAEGAKVILQLKRLTDEHLARVQFEESRVLQKTENLRVKHQKKMEDLQDQWQKRQQKHQDEVQELRSELGQMEENFEARWAEGDQKLRQLLEQQDQRAQEAISHLSTELLRQSELLKQEVEAAQEESNTQEVDLKEVGNSMEQEIKAQLELKKQAIEESSDAELQRFQSIRKHNEKATEHLIEEAKIFQQGIAYLRDAYSHTRKPRPRAPTDVSQSPYAQ
ncbi:unnamed protein product [Effrenium voratum]|uniref:Uncharacterized protein n=1 Tax=Effrenium voratum TaxID=2562239 RepID=A0AA36NID0_9DINO|nr:unnamed protein product [Effrenium voratum]